MDVGLHRICVEYDTSKLYKNLTKGSTNSSAEIGIYGFVFHRGQFGLSLPLSSNIRIWQVQCGLSCFSKTQVLSHGLANNERWKNFVLSYHSFLLLVVIIINEVEFHHLAKK